MNIIPEPKKVIYRNSISIANISGENIYLNSKDRLTGSYLEQRGGVKVNYMSMCTGHFALIGNKPGISLPGLPDEISGKDEGYYLRMDSSGIIITALSERGLFYGIQTLLQLKEEEISSELEIIDWPDTKIRGFHLELRFGMPDFERVIEIIDELALYKFNMLIIEYEDKFPFRRNPEIVSKNAFTINQIEKLQAYASLRRISVVPLQQTLGHLEYVLRHKEYYSLREVKDSVIKPEHPFTFRATGFNHFNDIDEICPVNEKSYELVEGLCDEVIQMHPESKYMHIGCDEAWNLLSCESCREKYGEKGEKQLFIDHVNRICLRVEAAEKIPMIWDDMLRKFDDDDFKLLSKNIIILCWFYFDSDFEIARELVKRYKKHGFRVFGASSAKCSEEPNLNYFDMPNMKERQKNIEGWATLAKDLEIEGLITTAWSNYSGVVAPPHPFFETIWYNIIFSAEKYWNNKSRFSSFEKVFIKNYFGVDGISGSFENNNETSYENFNTIIDNCTKHKYIAETYKAMALLSAYRVKSNYIKNEIYKQFTGRNLSEKAIVINRMNEVNRLREIVKALIMDLMKRYYDKRDIDEFINSRFFLDGFVFHHCLTDNCSNAEGLKAGM